MSSQARRPRNVIVFQHDRLEHPGLFRNFFREDGFQLLTVEVDEGEPIPNLDGFDLMVEIGVLPLSKTPIGETDQAMSDVPDPPTFFLWHGAEVVEVPVGAEVLAAS